MAAKLILCALFLSTVFADVSSTVDVDAVTEEDPYSMSMPKMMMPKMPKMMMPKMPKSMPKMQPKMPKMMMPKSGGGGGSGGGSMPKMMMGGGSMPKMGGGSMPKMMGGGSPGGMTPKPGMMMPSSGGPGAASSGTRAGVVAAAMALYNQRSHETYTQGSSRWSGITGKVMPPNAPPSSDCSAAATWCYWTQYGSGPDFLNGQNWKAGYTGSLIQHGKTVTCTAMQPGDLVFYGSPVNHVAIFVGNGKVVSHGSDPVSYVAYNYRTVNSCRSYL